MTARDKDRILAETLSRHIGRLVLPSQARILRRAQVTLRRWAELECGSEHGVIERDEQGKPYWVCARTGRRSPTADRERGALARVEAACRELGLTTTTRPPRAAARCTWPMCRCRPRITRRALPAFDTGAHTMHHTATYSPEDNKLRLYPAHRLDADTYARVKAAGFIWAPKQEVFVAPMWTLVIAIREAQPAARVEAVELSLPVANALASRCQGLPVIHGDFLEKTAFELGAPFDRIIMNPPFNGGVDIKHILHARGFLKPRGFIVGICAGGPRQAKTLRPLCDLWEPLPAGTFKQAGTEVHSVLFTMYGAVL